MRLFDSLGTSWLAHWLVLCVALWLPACTLTPPPIPGGIDHPADSNALQAPLPAPSTTLTSEPVQAKALPVMDHSRHRSRRR